jgi:non-heme chloroperoxidase
MPSIISPVDGARLFYTDYRPSATGSPESASPAFSPADVKPSTLPQDFTLVFLHGWPFSSEMYTHLTLPLSQNHQIRCIAPDRRGFGKSQWTGPNDAGEITYETFARDTVAILDAANITGDWAWVAASMGPGESVLAQEILDQAGSGSKLQKLGAACKGFLWLGPSLPYPLKSEANPTAPGREVWDSILAGFRADCVGFVKVAIDGVFGSRKDMGLDIVSVHCCSIVTS